MPKDTGKAPEEFVRGMDETDEQLRVRVKHGLKIIDEASDETPEMWDAASKLKPLSPEALRRQFEQQWPTEGAVTAMQSHRGGGKAFTMLQQKQFAVREAINKAVREFVGRELDDKLRWDLTTAAQEAGKKAAKQLGIRAPKVVVDRDRKDPAKIAVRIAFPLGGRL